MKDQDAKIIILKWFYSRRKDPGPHRPSSSDFSPPMPAGEINRICAVLDGEGMIRWYPSLGLPTEVLGDGAITCHGILIIEEDPARSPSKGALFGDVHIEHSSHVQIGIENTQVIVNGLQALRKEIDLSEGPEDQKKDAKRRLDALLRHPLVCAILGGATAGITRSLLHPTP